MGQFQDFDRKYGPAEHAVVPDAAAIERYRGQLPDALLAEWRDVGWCSYGNGLLWLTDPAQLSDIVEDFGELEGAGKPLVFLRTAFAHLYFWHNGAVFSLEVHRGSLSQVTPRIERMFTLLCDKEIAEKILRVSLYQEAVARLGPPARDECYAFEPALALGGPGTADTIRRVAVREHLGILAQLNR